MTKLAPLVACVLIFVFGPSCTGDDPPGMTQHQVCERLSTATCERMAVCEPTVAKAGCYAEVMAACCPDGVCADPVVATEERMAACEAALATLGCSDLVDRDMPEACEGLTDPAPGSGPGSGSGSGSGSGDPQDGVLEVNWHILAGGYDVACHEFHGTTHIRIVATPPSGSSITRDFTCDQGSALTTLPAGPYSVYAQARNGAQIVQQTLAQTVGVSSGGASASFTFTVTTTLGPYCDQLASVSCDACAPGDTTCHAEVYGACCADDGVCGRPAIAKPQFSACLSEIGSGAYCMGGAPSCAGALRVW